MYYVILTQPTLSPSSHRHSHSSITHSLSHSLTLSFTHSLIHSLTHSLYPFSLFKFLSLSLKGVAHLLGVGKMLCVILYILTCNPRHRTSGKAWLLPETVIDGTGNVGLTYYTRAACMLIAINAKRRHTIP
jgi:hypothetical protein